RLAAAGASAEPAALDDWFALVGGASAPRLDGPAVPDGLAVKLHPCCYAMQRPISAARRLPYGERQAEDVARITVTTPAAGMQPLIHHRPRTGLEAKFSMEYAVATALLDGFPGMADFTDAAVRRPEVGRLLERTEVRVTEFGVRDGGLMGGETRIAVEDRDGEVAEAALELPQGHPRRPATDAELAAKVAACVGAERAAEITGLTWESAAPLLRAALPAA
ncbi:2-methylcitrate dehydratase, partial [Streptomyces nanshensis]